MDRPGVAYKLRLQFFQQTAEAVVRLPRPYSLRRSDHARHARHGGLRGFIEQGLLRAVSLILLVVLSAWAMFRSDPLMALLAMSFVPFAGWRLARMGYLLRVTWLQFQRLMSILTRTMEENLQGIRVGPRLRRQTLRDGQVRRGGAGGPGAGAPTPDRAVQRRRGAQRVVLRLHGPGAVVRRAARDRRRDDGRPADRLPDLHDAAAGAGADDRHDLHGRRARHLVRRRVFEVLDIVPEIQDPPDAKALVLTQGVLRFEHVDFRYDEGGPLILRDVSFEVPPGKTLGIVGPPGSGKTTIANLIPRFYDVSGGRVTVDGQDVRDVTLASPARARRPVCSRRPSCSTLVINNVAYADPWADEPRIQKPPRRRRSTTTSPPCQAATRPASANAAYRCPAASASGCPSPAGVVPGPGIMIFDDSTAAIDAVTERAVVREGLSSATKQKATIIIAHRLSSLMHADEILVLDDGEVVERGTHAELLAQEGEYAALYELQSKSDAGRPAGRPAHRAARKGGRQGRDGEGMSDFAFDRDMATPPPGQAARRSQTARQPGVRRRRGDLRLLRHTRSWRVPSPMCCPTRGTLVLAMFGVALFVGCQVAIPWAISQAVTATVAKDLGRLQTMVLLFGGLLVLNTFASFLEQWVSARMAQKVILRPAPLDVRALPEHQPVVHGQDPRRPDHGPPARRRERAAGVRGDLGLGVRRPVPADRDRRHADQHGRELGLLTLTVLRP